MSLTYEGIEYRTIDDVTKRYGTSQKTVKKLMKEGTLPQCSKEKRGQRQFNHFDDNWIAKADVHFEYKS